MKHLAIQDQLFTLPSMGELYDDLPLIGGTDVRLRSLVAADQKQMTSNATDQYRMYVQMLTKFIVEPTPMPVDQMLLSDAAACLYAVYLVSHGPEFEVAFACDYCNSATKKIVLLTDLEAVYASDKVDDGVPFAANGCCELESGAKIHFHLPRVADERMAKMHMDRAKKRGKAMTTHDMDLNFYRLATYIDDIVTPDELPAEGEEIDQTTQKPRQVLHIEKKEAYLESLPMRDFQEFQEAVRDADVGLQPQMNIQCGRCYAENEVLVVLGANFFRPPKRSR